MLAVNLPAELEQRLEDLARKTGRDKSDYVREAIAEHLDDLEDLHLAEERFRQLQAGKDGTISLADLMKIHGLEN